jgi:Asp-tRNA(Asn)/Glu-tRNA(Gln) amidotransferase A subunit family amidase
MPCHAPLASYRLAVARSTMLDDLDSPLARAFERSLGRLRAAGTQITEIDFQLDAAKDAEFWRINALLLRNTSVVNFWMAVPLAYPAIPQMNYLSV